MDEKLDSVGGNCAPQCYSPKLALLNQLDRQIGECIDRAQRLMVLKSRVELEKDDVADMLIYFQGLIVSNRT